jgi:hypothetical protein
MVDTLEGECCVEDALRMETWKSCRIQACAEEVRKQLPTQMAKGVIVRILSFCGNTPPLIVA